MSPNPSPKNSLQEVINNRLSNHGRLNTRPSVLSKMYLLAWLVIFSLLFISYHYQYKVPVGVSLLLAIRIFINTLFVYFLFFNAFVPLSLRLRWKLGIVILALAIPILIYVWVLVNYLITYLYLILGIEVTSGELKDIISGAIHFGFIKTFMPLRVLSNVIMFIYMVSPLFLLKIFGELIKSNRRNYKILEEKKEIEIRNIETEKNLLKYQLNPHFLFNTLNNLYGMVVTHNENAPQLILDMSDTMSYILYEAANDQVPVQREIAFIRHYFNVERARHSSSKDIQLTIQQPDYLPEKRIIPLITFPFVENAFKYGLKSKEYGFLNAEIKVSESTFLFKIKNDKSVWKANKTGGIGIENVRKRLDLNYPSEYSLLVQDKADIFKVELKINFKKA